MADTRSRVIDTALRRAGLPLDNLPRDLKVLNVKTVDTDYIWPLICLSMKKAREELGSVRCVIIDGIADLLRSVNDEAASIELTRGLLSQATEFDTGIITVTYANPSSSNSDKGRGHLGSQLERKAEAVVTLKRVKHTDLTEIEVPIARRDMLIGGNALLMRWNPEVGMHTLVEASVIKDKKIGENLLLLSLVWGENLQAPLKKTEIIKRLCDKTRMGDSARAETDARRLFSSWCLSDTYKTDGRYDQLDLLTPVEGKKGYFVLGEGMLEVARDRLKMAEEQAA